MNNFKQLIKCFSGFLVTYAFTKRLTNSAHLTPFSARISLNASVAQLVEHRAVPREVVSSTPAGPSLRVLK